MNFVELSPSVIKNARTKNNLKTSRHKGGFFESRIGYLKLADGKTFIGKIPFWQNDSSYAEVVFNTGMTGYVESLTDPSYSKQILTFTYPIIGNYGVHKHSWESDRIYASGVVVDNLTNNWSHPKSEYSFLEWLNDQKVPLIFDVDTRSLTKHLRTRGVVNGYITAKKSFKVKKEASRPLVSISEPKLYKTIGAIKTVVLLDCGAKQNIVRSLQARRLNVLRVPYNYNFSNLPQEEYSGVILSNGPGNPEDYGASIESVKKLLKGAKPVFGICLGNQLMSLAAGAKTYKLKFGHRGHNQPCINKSNKKCIITSQNHGYAVDEKSLNNDWEVLFTNLNDGSVEGIRHKTKPFFAVQFHPEAAPGPTDANYLFGEFVRLIK